MTASALKDHYQVLILGGGTAGITVAAQLRRNLKTYDVAIVEPSTIRACKTYAIAPEADKPLEALTPERFLHRLVVLAAAEG